MIKTIIPRLLVLILKIAYIFRKRRIQYELPKVDTILIVGRIGIGNMLFFTPIIVNLKRNFPNANFILLKTEIQPLHELFENEFNEIISIDDWSLKNIISTITILRKKEIDLAYCNFVSATFYMSFVLFFSRIKLLVGHGNSLGYFNNYDFIFHISVPMHETEHEIERNLNLLKYSGIEVTTDQMAISVSIVALKKIEDRLRDLKIENSIPKIGLAPGSNANGWWKRWGKERYLELARQIIDNYPKASIILIGGKDEEEEANFIIEQLNDKSAISFVNKTSIKEFIALIHLCDLVIGNDTGPVHVASALNRPAICIWGPSYYQRAHLRHKTGINIWKNVPCSPCYKDSGTKKVLSCNDRVCLSTITVDEVFTAVQELLTQLDC